MCLLTFPPGGQVELQVTAIHVVSRAGPLAFELVDAARSEVQQQWHGQLC